VYVKLPESAERTGRLQQQGTVICDGDGDMNEENHENKEMTRGMESSSQTPSMERYYQELGERNSPTRAADPAPFKAVEFPLGFQNGATSGDAY